MNYPTKESVMLALEHLQLAEQTQEALMSRAVEIVKVQQEVFGQNPHFIALVEQIHAQLRHSPVLMDCALHKSMIFAMMVQMFIGGYSAGQQEIIDKEVARMGKANST